MPGAALDDRPHRRGSTCRTATEPPDVAAARRSKHDAILSAALDTTSRAEIGAVTNLGRLIRFTAVDLPMRAAELGAARRRARGSATTSALADREERVLGLVSLDSDRRSRSAPSRAS